MDKLIPVINKLQDVFAVIGADLDSTTMLDLPQIVVVGSQSAGKSSVLENIVGRDFLPRGSGIVTRRPLILQLLHTPPNSSNPAEEWGEFLHKKGEVFVDFNKIREEIAAETDRGAGKGKNIVHTPINLKLFSPNVLNLTLVDLPGITRVPIDDQPKDIEIQIKNMVRKFIVKQNAIILAVSAANTDLANSDALQLAREVDPHGNRTIGVITKLDLMDKGTDALDILEGRLLPLKLGYIGVVNRSQLDINTRKPIQDALKDENAFFKANYPKIADRSGTAYLASTLNKILLRHIRGCLPDLKNRINEMLRDNEKELLMYGDPLSIESSGGKGALLLNVINKFAAKYRAIIDGDTTDLAMNQLHGGARINYIFNDNYARKLNVVDPLEGLREDEIKFAIKNATGPKKALFIPESSFEVLVKRQISKLREPSLECVDLAYDELKSIVRSVEMEEMTRFRNLRERVLEVVDELLSNCRGPAKKMIRDLVALETSFINTSHPDFISGGEALAALMHLQKQQEAEEEEKARQASMPQPATGAPQPGVSQPQSGVHNSTQVASRGSSTDRGRSSASAKGSGGNIFGIFFSRDDSKKTRDAEVQLIAKQVKAKDPPRRSDGRADKKEFNKEEFEMQLIQFLIVSYFKIVRKNIVDIVPKAIMHFLVLNSQNLIQNELVAKLYKSDLFDSLFEENSDIASKREACKTKIEVLRKAQRIIGEVTEDGSYGMNSSSSYGSSSYGAY